VSKETIFREVVVGTGQKITLGATVPSDVQSMMTPAGNNSYKLKAGDFSRAESITVTVDASSKVVTTMNFKYAPGTSYAALVTTYTEAMGSPASTSGNSATWNDGQTSFQLTGNGGSVTSVLTDL
jgi:spore germination protein YaaH